MTRQRYKRTTDLNIIKIGNSWTRNGHLSHKLLMVNYKTNRKPGHVTVFSSDRSCYGNSSLLREMSVIQSDRNNQSENTTLAKNLIGSCLSCYSKTDNSKERQLQRRTTPKVVDLKVLNTAYCFSIAICIVPAKLQIIQLLHLAEAITQCFCLRPEANKSWF